MLMLLFIGALDVEKMNLLSQCERYSYREVHGVLYGYAVCL